MNRAIASEPGVALVELLISTLILAVVSGAVFTLLADTARTASYQGEVHGALDNARIALETAERAIRQAGNDPLGAGFPAVTLIDSTHIRLRSDLTGSAPGNADKGDPDGDTEDAGEDVTLQYNAGTRSVEIAAGDAPGQPIANHIAAFTVECLDASGGAAATGAEVRRVRVRLTAAAATAHPATGRTFAVELSSDVLLAVRQ